MILPSKKLATIASLVGGLVYFSQNYTIDGLRGLRISQVSPPTSLPTSQPTQSNYYQPTMRDGTPSSSVWGAVPALEPSKQTVPGTSPTGAANWIPDIARTVSNFTASSGLIGGNGAARTPASQIGGLSALPGSLRAPSLKIASFNLQQFGQHKLENPFITETVVKIIKQFDVIALQEIATQQQDLIAILTDRINVSGARFDYLIGPRVGKGENLEQFAFIFNTETVETDREQLYTVEDPDNLLLRDPLVGWFRSKQSDAHKAFTFTLVNFHSDPERTAIETRLIPELIQSIHRDGRREDDVIVVGDFGIDSDVANSLKMRGFQLTLDGNPTLVNGSMAADNILLSSRGTDEYIGRSGTYDFLRKSNLSINQALQVSDHLPVWAEFSTSEGAAY